MQPHSWIEPHPIQNLIQPQLKNSFETIEPQLEYNPTSPVKSTWFQIFYPLAVQTNFGVFGLCSLTTIFKIIWKFVDSLDFQMRNNS